MWWAQKLSRSPRRHLKTTAQNPAVVLTMQKQRGNSSFSGSSMCVPFHFVVVTFLFCIRAGALKYEDLEEEFGNDVDFLFAKLKLSFSNVSQVSGGFHGYVMLCAPTARV